jgi:hypothetical protein
MLPDPGQVGEPQIDGRGLGQARPRSGQAKEQVAMNEFVLSGLVKRRAELAGDIENTQAASKAARASSKDSAVPPVHSPGSDPG